MHKKLTVFLGLAFCIAASGAVAELIARDTTADPAYAGGFADGQNGGFGFEPWSIGLGTNSTALTGDSGANGFGGGPGINTANLAWGLQASDGDLADAIRPFSAPLAVGQTIRYYWDYGFVEGGSTVGVGLQNASGENLFEIFFTGGASAIQRSDNAGVTDTALGFSSDGFSVEFTLTSATDYTVTLTNRNSLASDTFSGTLSSPAGGQSIAQIRFFNFNSAAANGTDQGWHYFFNVVQIDNNQAPASANAYDSAFDAAYSGGFSGGLNGGFGLEPWVINVGASSSALLGDSVANGFGLPPGANTTGGTAFGLQAANGETAEAIRPLSTPLAAGDTIGYLWDYGFIENGSTVGVALQNASGENLFELFFAGGASANQRNDSAGVADTALGYSSDGFRVEFTLTSPTEYTATLTNLNSLQSDTFSGTLLSPSGGQAIAQIRFFNANAAGPNGADPAWHAFINAIEVQPAPLAVRGWMSYD